MNRVDHAFQEYIIKNDYPECTKNLNQHELYQLILLVINYKITHCTSPECIFYVDDSLLCYNTRRKLAVELFQRFKGRIYFRYEDHFEVMMRPRVATDYIIKIL